MGKHLKSIYQQHFLLTAGMILLSFAMLGVSFMGLTYRYAVTENKDSLGESAVYISNLLSLLLKEGEIEIGDERLNQYLSYVAASPNADVLICGKDGKVLYAYNGDSSDDAIRSGKVQESSLRDTRSRKSYQTTSDLGIYDEKRFVVGTPVVVRERVKGFVYVTASMSNLTAMWRNFGILFTVSACAVLLIAFLSSFLSTRQQARPLKEMADVVRRFGMGEYTLRVPDDERNDEIGQLAAAFNNMADAIASAEQRRQEFVANISHELKTPMTTISGFTDGILDGTIPPERQRESLQVVSEETRRLSRLVRRMLDMSQLSAREQTVLCQSQFNIVETFAQVLISLERKITQRGLDVDAQFPDSDLMVWGDPDGITQVCYNLLDNAIKFAAPGSVIGVSIVPKGGKAWVSVRNQGETIPPEELTLIFDRFHKSDRSRSMDKDGVGLGLYIVKTILNNHQENITVTSQDGLTEFQFTLTLAE